jgi:hypothetical protein
LKPAVFDEIEQETPPVSWQGSAPDHIAGLNESTEIATGSDRPVNVFALLGSRSCTGPNAIFMTGVHYLAYSTKPYAGPLRQLLIEIWPNMM